MSDNDALRRVKESLILQGASHAKDYAAHIDVALQSRSEKPIAVPRTLAEVEKTLGRAPYVGELGVLSELTRANCHIGQRKLALALIEFMNISATIHKTMDLFVVYAGGSILASLAAAELYPAARFLCFDPAFDATVTNVRQELGHRADTVMRNVHVVRAPVADRSTALDAFARGSNIVVFSDDAGMYGDESHTLVRKVHADLYKQDARKREIVFCSDVRMDVARTVDGGIRTHEPSELQIAQEMISQAVWTKNLDVKCVQLKFRMPFALEPTIQAMYEQLYSKLNVSKRSADTGSDGTLPYLSGDFYVQLYARETSAELRLVGTSGVSVKRYSLRTIEETMASFNVVHRSHTCFKPPGEQAASEAFMKLVRDELSPKSLPCVSYDAVCEGSIICNAIRLSGGPRDTVTLLHKMRAFASLYASGRHPQTCAARVQQNHTDRPHGRPHGRNKGRNGNPPFKKNRLPKNVEPYDGVRRGGTVPAAWTIPAVSTATTAIVCLFWM